MRRVGISRERIPGVGSTAASTKEKRAFPRGGQKFISDIDTVYTHLGWLVYRVLPLLYLHTFQPLTSVERICANLRGDCPKRERGLRGKM